MSTPSVALEAILAAEERLQNLGRADLRFAFQALAEGTWWVAALDEQLVSQLKAAGSAVVAAYKADRSSDPDGQYIPAYRATHEVVASWNCSPSSGSSADFAPKPS